MCLQALSPLPFPFLAIFFPRQRACSQANQSTVPSLTWVSLEPADPHGPVQRASFQPPLESTIQVQLPLCPVLNNVITLTFAFLTCYTPNSNYTQHNRLKKRKNLGIIVHTNTLKFFHQLLRSLTLSTLKLKWRFSFTVPIQCNRSSGENWLKYQLDSSSLIMYSILMTTVFQSTDIIRRNFRLISLRA